MANSLKTLSNGDITNEGLRILKNSNNILNCIDRQYDDRWSNGAHGAKNGGLLQARLPNRYPVGTGRTITIPADSTEQTITIGPAVQRHVPMTFFSDEMTLSIERFSERYIRPAISRLASYIALDVATACVQGFHQHVGTPGTTPSSFLTYGTAAELLDWQTAPEDGRRFAVLSPTAMVALADAQKGLFHSGNQIEKGFEDGAIELMTGLHFRKDQSLPVVAHGAGASYLTNTPTFTSGSSTLAVDTGTGALTAGQTFTLAGHFEINPDTQQSTGRLKMFGVATNYAGGAGNIQLTQPIYTSGAYQNISAAPADNTALTLQGSASTSYPRSLVMHKEACTLVMADLEKPKGLDISERASMDGVSIRFLRDYDSINDQWIARWDVLYAVKVLRPEFGVQVYG
jgi:hypothetical protein